ncbi:MAG: zinc ribbon domain-containing protein [Ruminococcus sp.]|nr:zinc ribbon domain-containing protein [Ruminococcus sp.]
MSNFFDKVSEAITATGKTVGDKTKMGTDIVKLSYKLSTEQKNLSDIFTEIGKAYYEESKDAPQSDALVQLVSEATVKSAEIEGIKEQIRQIKGVTVCPNCGADVPLEYDFCGKCGTKIERPEPPAEETEETVEETDEIKVEVDDNFEE